MHSIKMLLIKCTTKIILLAVWIFSLSTLLHAQECERVDPRNFVCNEVAVLADAALYIEPNTEGLSIVNRHTTTEITAQRKNNFKNIQKLDLSKALSLTLDDYVLEQFSNLKILNISHCQLEKLSGKYFGSLVARNLQFLDASNNEILKIETELTSQLPNLIFANFSNNLISNIEMHAFKNLRQLNTLDLTSNELTNVTIGDCASLRYLALGNNNLKDFPWYVLDGLPQLEVLHLDSNWLKRLDNNIFAYLKHLRILNLSNNNIEIIRPHLLAGIDGAVLKILELSSNNIENLDDYLFQNLPKLEILNLHNNNIDLIKSKVFHGLVSLRELYLQHNKISIIEDMAFANLFSLEILDLSQNEIESFNARIFGDDILPNMRSLNLAANNLIILYPLSFSSLPYLEELNLGRNKLTTLDIRMYAPLRQLRILHLNENLLEDITTPVLESFERISQLYINNNRLTYLPNVKVDYPNLRIMTIEGNPWQCPCFNELTNWLGAHNIVYTRLESAYFSGKKPICIVTSVDFCVKQLHLVRQHGIADKYAQANKS